jgi:hypothetical protein
MSTAATTTAINYRVNCAELTAAVINPTFWRRKGKLKSSEWCGFKPNTDHTALFQKTHI